MKSILIFISVIVGSYGLIKIVKRRKWSDISGSTSINILNHLLLWYLFANILFVLYVFVLGRIYASIIVANGEPMNGNNQGEYVAYDIAANYNSKALIWQWVYTIGSLVIYVLSFFTTTKIGIQKSGFKDIVYMAILIIASIILSFYSIMSILLLIDEFGVVTGG